METWTMSGKELRRAAAFSRVQDGGWSLAEAARHLKISYRQASAPGLAFNKPAQPA